MTQPQFKHIIMAMEKSYSHKPHLAELPHDRRTHDPEKLQERIDAIHEKLEEINDEIEFQESNIRGSENTIESDREFFNKLIDTGKESINSLKESDFDINDYGELPEDAHEPYGIINDYKHFKESVPTVEECLNKLEPQLKDLIKDPSTNVSQKDIDNYYEATKLLENGTARMMRIYDFGPEGNEKAMQLYDDSHSLNWKAELLGMTVNSYKTQVEDIKEYNKEISSLNSKKDDFLDELDKTEAKKEQSENKDNG